MFVLFAAMLVYLGVYLFRSTQQSYATAPAVLVTVSESGQASGIVVREEQVIASDKEFLSLSVDDGKEVARGGEIAIGVDSKAALDSASRARELKKEIAYVSSLLARAGSASGASDRDSDVRSAILQLNAAVSAGSTSDLDDICLDLSSLLFGSTSGSISQGDLDALNAELHQLENAGAGRGSITAPAAGLFTSMTDGYESLTPDMLENLTPDGVDALERTAPTKTASAIGKLVTAKKWYFASVMNKADADRLNLNGSASLDFPQHYNGTVSATVMSKSEPDSSGKVAVVFACNAALADTLPCARRRPTWSTASTPACASRSRPCTWTTTGSHMSTSSRRRNWRKNRSRSSIRPTTTVSSPRARRATPCAPATRSSSPARACPTGRS